jgi:hypothetical protein
MTTAKKKTVRRRHARSREQILAERQRCSSVSLQYPLVIDFGDHFLTYRAFDKATQKKIGAEGEFTFGIGS